MVLGAFARQAIWGDLGLPRRFRPAAGPGCSGSEHGDSARGIWIRVLGDGMAEFPICHGGRGELKRGFQTYDPPRVDRSLEPTLPTPMVNFNTTFLAEDLARRLDGMDHSRELVDAAREDLEADPHSAVDAWTWWIRAFETYRRDPTPEAAAAILDGSIVLDSGGPAQAVGG